MLTRLSYATRFEPHLTAIQTFLETQLAPQEPEVLWAAMRHGVLNGGKRIRPVLLTDVCRAAGGTFAHSLPTAAALELIHCYSLIHDDLPCMDNDDMRRGQPTVHKAFSENVAVLAGDALVAMAFGLIPDLTQDVSAKTLLQVISKLSKAASVQGLVNGQIDDLQFAQAVPTETILYRIHRGKTGALFRFATEAGALLAGQPAGIVETMGRYGEALGVIFQIADDLLDIQASGDVLGKTPGKDAAQGKITFPAVYGVDGAEQKLTEHLEEGHRLLDDLSRHMDTENLRYLLQFAAKRES